MKSIVLIEKRDVRAGNGQESNWHWELPGKEMRIEALLETFWIQELQCC